MTPEPKPKHCAAVRIADDHVTLPPRTSLMTTAYWEGTGPDVDTIVESVRRLLLHRGVSVARGIAWYKQHKSHVLVTNFTEEYQQLNNGAAIAFLEETQQASDVIAVADFDRATRRYRQEFASLRREFGTTARRKD